MMTLDFDSQQTANQNPQGAAVHLVRKWPSPAWLQVWINSTSTLILSEQALQELAAQPQLIDALPVLPYALHAEIVLLDLQEHLSASLIQLGDARWVELTLDAERYMVWDNV